MFLAKWELTRLPTVSNSSCVWIKNHLLVHSINKIYYITLVMADISIAQQITSSWLTYFNRIVIALISCQGKLLQREFYTNFLYLTIPFALSLALGDTNLHVEKKPQHKICCVSKIFHSTDSDEVKCKQIKKSRGFLTNEGRRCVAIYSEIHSLSISRLIYKVGEIKLTWFYAAIRINIKIDQGTYEKQTDYNWLQFYPRHFLT